MPSPSTERNPLNWRGIATGGFLGCLAIGAAWGLEAKWGWDGVTPSVLVNIGSTVALAGVVFWLERRFAGTVENAVSVERAERATEITKVRARVSEIQDRMRDLIAEHDASIAQALDRARDTPDYDTLTDVFQRAIEMNALWAPEVTVPTSHDMTGNSLQFRWGPRRYTNNLGSAYWEGPDMLHIESGLHGFGGPHREERAIVWDENTDITEFGLAVRQALIAGSAPVDEASFSWIVTLNNLSDVLRLAIDSQKRTPGRPKFSGKIKRLFTSDLVGTTVGIETTDGRIILSAEEVRKPAIVSENDTQPWRPASSKPDDISDRDWQWLSSWAQSEYSLMPYRMRPPAR